MVNATRPGRVVETRVTTIDGNSAREAHDLLAAEEPLKLRIAANGATRTLAMTMRTPGNDFELAAGFAFGEGIIGGRDGIRGIRYCDDDASDTQGTDYNAVTIDLALAALPDTIALERHFTITSACGVCGRAELQALHDRVTPLDDTARISAHLLTSLPERMREEQGVFAKTGGLHAAAFFNADGTLLAAREDVGRHNAVDKLIGWALLNDRLPLSGTALVVSGRASYEIIQKAIVARIPIVAAVSAPSSLAVALARDFNVTLCGFVRAPRANVYTARERIISEQRSTEDG